MGLALQTCSSVADAQSALDAAGARYMGGGTLVVRAANEGDLSFSTIVRATDPVLSAIEVTGGRARLGASVTMSAVMAHSELGFLARAAGAVGGPAVRNMATVGGNLFAPAPYGDFATALLALDATLNASDGEMPLEEFLQKRDARETRSIVTSVVFAVPPTGEFRFHKVSRVRPNGATVLTIAACLEEGAGVIRSARIALGAMARHPIRAHAAEAALAGHARTKEGIAKACEAVLDGIDPPTDAIASSWYRREVLPVHLGRLLLA